jgi:hypothetical protein
MQSPVNDTHPEVERILIEGYRRMTPTQKFRMTCGMMDAGRRQLARGIRDREPHLTEAEFRFRFAQLWLGSELAERIRERMTPHE